MTHGSVVRRMTFISLAAAPIPGFNFLIPANVALPGEQDVKQDESRFNPVLENQVLGLLGERYSLALAKFREAEVLLPGLVVVKRSMREARTSSPTRRPGPFPGRDGRRAAC